MADLPSGTITFLFTDIEGSTQLWEKFPAEMNTTLAKHDAILNENIESNRGLIIKTTGDGVHAVFVTVIDAIQAALSIQYDLQLLHDNLQIKVRMGLHTGEAERRGDDYFGQTLNRAARIMSAGHGGQILISSVTAELAREHLPENTNLLDLGEHRLKSLSKPEHLYQINASGLRTEFPALNSLNSRSNNLPVQLTSFIGRQHELSEIKQKLEGARLLTLTGSGGTGKTRLSQEIGAQELIDFPQGVWLIELASLTDPSQIIPAIAQVFGLQELPFSSLTNLVIDYLRDKKLLLILDNCEHLIQSCARLADDLLHQCIGLKILTSSREALGIAGEVSYHVPSLADSESTQLFVDRANAVNGNFKLTDRNAASIAQICSRLDGIPLAIELAAARVKLLSPEQIAARLDDMFRLLVGGNRTALPRQQTLRALIDWSYDLLSEEEKRLLQFASVFVGGWTLDALEAVADDPNTIEHLEQLVNKSLIVTEERENEMRYFMLETIRQYAREKLFDTKQMSTARDRHFFYFNKLSEELWETYRAPDALPVLTRVEDEVENFRAALEWGLENHVEENLRLAANFCATATTLSIPAEGVGIVIAAFERVKALPPVEGEAHLYRQKLIARALFVQGMVGLGVGNLPSVIHTLKEGIAISRAIGDKQLLGYNLGMYYTASTFINAPDGEQAAQEAFQIFSQEVNDSFGLGTAYMNMARVASNKGAESEKERYLGMLRHMVYEMPKSFQISMLLLGMGMDERIRGNFDKARNIFEEGLELFKRLRSRHFVLVMRSELGHIERQQGNLTQARLIYHETIKGWQELGNRSAVAHEIECFGFLAIREEEPERAVKLFSAAEALREKIQAPMTDYERVEYDQAFTQVRSLLAEAKFVTLWAEGRSMTMEQAIEFALKESND